MIEITYTHEFKRLSRKYSSLTDDVKALISELSDNPSAGKSLGGNIFKVRLAIKSKGKGKSAGARVITYLFLSEAKLYLLLIYDKSEKATVTSKEVRALIDSITK